MFGGELLPRESDPQHTSASVSTDVSGGRSRGALELENSLFFSPRRPRLHSVQAASPYKRLKTTKTPPKFDMSSSNAQDEREEDGRDSIKLEPGVQPFRSPVSGPFSPLPSRFRSPVLSRSETYASTQTRECRPEFSSFRICHGRLRRRRQPRSANHRGHVKTEPVTLFAEPGPARSPMPSSKLSGRKAATQKQASASATARRSQQGRGAAWSEGGQSNGAKGEQYGNVLPSGLGVELERLVSKLGLSAAVKRRSYDLFRDVVNHSAIIDGNLRCTLSACVYFACIQENCPFDTHEIAFHLDISPLDVETYSRTVGVILGLHYQPVSVKDIMRRVCSKLGISSHIIAASEHVADAILHLPLKRQPTIYVCASAVRLVCQRQTIIGCMYTTEKVADVANVCVKRLKAFLEVQDLLVLFRSVLPW